MKRPFLLTIYLLLVWFFLFYSGTIPRLSTQSVSANHVPLPFIGPVASGSWYHDTPTFNPSNGFVYYWAVDNNGHIGPNHAAALLMLVNIPGNGFYIDGNNIKSKNGMWFSTHGDPGSDTSFDPVTGWSIIDCEFSNPGNNPCFDTAALGNGNFFVGVAESSLRNVPIYTDSSLTQIAYPPTTELLPYQSSGYRYKVIGSADLPPAGFEQPEFDDTSWGIGAAAFGSGPQNGGCSLENSVQTSWPINTQLLIRRSIAVPAEPIGLEVRITVDNDIVGVFFNGTLIYGPASHENCPNLDDFVIPVPQALVHSGTNLIACQLSDRGDESYFDARVLSVTPQCSIECTASAPPNALRGSSISFMSTATASAGCVGPPLIDWDFGDGSHSSEQNPSHTYTTAGTYTWRMSVTVGANECEQTGNITVSEAKTETGFNYPISVEITGNENWNTCGATYYTDLRHIGADLFYDAAPHNNNNNIDKPVYAISKGTVLKKSGPCECSRWGISNYALAITHTSTAGDFVAVYGHIHTNFKVGDPLVAGEQIGTIGAYQEHESIIGMACNCKVSGAIITRSAHVHFGVYPNAMKFPSSGWGIIDDKDCKHPDKTGGFVNPLEWIRTKVPIN